MHEYAFEAAAEFDGATCALADGSLVDIGELLDDGNGRIETDDENLANALRGHPELREIPTEAPKPGSKAAIAAELAALGVAYSASANKTELEKLLADAQAAQANPPAANPDNNPTDPAASGTGEENT